MSWHMMVEFEPPHRRYGAFVVDGAAIKPKSRMRQGLPGALRSIHYTSGKGVSSATARRPRYSAQASLRFSVAAGSAWAEIQSMICGQTSA
jgi:hypothetical protein